MQKKPGTTLLHHRFKREQVIENTESVLDPDGRPRSIWRVNRSPAFLWEWITAMKLRSAAKMLSVAAVLATGGALAAPSASAAPAAASCPPGIVCFWKNAFFTGSISPQSRLNSGGGSIANFQNSHFNDGTGLNDQASSIQNNTSCKLVVYTNANFGGSSLPIDPGGSIQDLGTFPGFNDQLSSAQMRC